MEHLKPPESLDFDSSNLAEDWRRWKQSWDIYSLAARVSSKDENVQCAILLHVAGPGAQQINQNFEYTNDEKE